MKLKTYSKLIYSAIKQNIDKPTVLNIGLIILGIVGSVIAYEQFQISAYQYALESYKPQIYPLITNYTFIKNNVYKQYPFSEKMTFSVASPHYLRLEISDVNLIQSSIPNGNYSFPARIDFGRPIIKFIDRGVTNEEFEIPFLLTFDGKHLPTYSNDTTLAVISLVTNVRVLDIQDNNKTICCSTPLDSGLAIPGEYLPKHQLIKVEN